MRYESFQIILSSHSTAAQGIYDTFGFIFLQKTPHIHTISLGEEGIEDFQNRFFSLCRSFKKDSYVLVLCDIYGGSPFNTASSYLTKNPDHPLFMGVLGELSLPSLYLACDLIKDHWIDGRFELNSESFKKFIHNLEIQVKSSIRSVFLSKEQKSIIENQCEEEVL